MKSKVFFSSLALIASCAVPAMAAVVTSINFSSPIVTSATQAPGTFYTDRYAPNDFAVVGGELLVTVSGADSASNRPGAFSSAFYNTQGRKYDLDPRVTMIEADLFLDSAWASSGQREAGLWGTAFNATNDISFYPIIEYANGAFRGWNGVNGYIGLGSGNTGGFNTLGIELDTALNQWNYLINHVVAGSVGAAGSVYLGNVIFQAHNNYSLNQQGTKQVRWDNFLASDGRGNNVPEPGTLALASLSLIGLCFMNRRRQRIVAPVAF